MAEALAAGLARRGFRADIAHTVADATLMLETVQYAALLLDLGLPDADGLALLRRLRESQADLPVLVMTARGDVAQRITGLTAGADDYLVKPVDLDELKARIEAVLRRQEGHAGRALTLGRISLDGGSLLLDGTAVILPARELELLELLMRRAGRVVAKRIAEDQLFGLGEELGSNAIEVYVHRLRRRLEALDAGVTIETVRGLGYLLRVR